MGAGKGIEFIPGGTNGPACEVEGFCCAEPPGAGDAAALDVAEAVDPDAAVVAFWPGLTRRLRMLRSDICSRCVTGGTRASVAGRRPTSCFMSLSSSSNWFRTGREMYRTGKKYEMLIHNTAVVYIQNTINNLKIFLIQCE